MLLKTRDWRGLRRESEYIFNPLRAAIARTQHVTRNTPHTA